LPPSGDGAACGPTVPAFLGPASAVAKGYARRR